MNNFSKVFLVGNLLAASFASNANDLIPMQSNDQKIFESNNNTVIMEVVDTIGESWKKYSTFLGSEDQWVWSSKTSQEVIWFDRNGNYQLLVNFNDSVGTEYSVDIDGCTDTAVLSSKTHGISIAAGDFYNSTLLTFSGQCADAGLATAVFAPGVGLIAYSEQSIIGPVATEMVSAIIDTVEYPVIDDVVEPIFTGIEATAQFPVGVVLSNVQNKVTALLTLTNHSAIDEVFNFNSSQLFDIEIRDASGEVVNLWSTNIRFTMAKQSIVIAAGESETFGGDISLVDFTGQTLDVGSYVIRIEMKGSNAPEGSVFSTVPFASESPLFIDQRVTIAN